MEEASEELPNFSTGIDLLSLGPVIQQAAKFIVVFKFVMHFCYHARYVLTLFYDWIWQQQVVQRQD